MRTVLPEIKWHKINEGITVGKPTCEETPTCRGSMILGTACGHCPKCLEERAKKLTSNWPEWKKEGLNKMMDKEIPIPEGTDKGEFWHIKLNRKEQIEKHLPPSREVYVVNDQGQLSMYSINHEWIEIDLQDLEIRSRVIGRVYEFSDDGKSWYKQIYFGYIFTPYSNARFCGGNKMWRLMRNVDVFELTKNGERVEITEDVLNCLKNVIT